MPWTRPAATPATFLISKQMRIDSLSKIHFCSVCVASPSFPKLPSSIWKLLHQFFTWTVLFVLPTVARLKLCCWLGFESPLQLDILGFQRYFRLSTMSKVEYFKVWPISAIKCDWKWNLKYYSFNLKVTSSNLVTTLLIFLTWNAF